MEMSKQIKVAPASGQVVTPPEEIARTATQMSSQSVCHNPIVAVQHCELFSAETCSTVCLHFFFMQASHTFAFRHPVDEIGFTPGHKIELYLNRNYWCIDLVYLIHPETHQVPGPNDSW